MIQVILEKIEYQWHFLTTGKNKCFELITFKNTFEYLDKIFRKYRLSIQQLVHYYP